VQIVTDAEHDRIAGFKGEPVAHCQGRQFFDDVDHYVAEINCSTGQRAVGLDAREQQQVLDQPDHPAGGVQRGVRQLCRLALEVGDEQFEIGEHDRQRRA
jgi:hypothetical protein